MQDGASLILHGGRVDQGEVRMREDEELINVSDDSTTISHLHSSYVSALHEFPASETNRYIIYAYDTTVEILSPRRVHMVKYDTGYKILDISHLGNVIMVATEGGLRYIYYQNSAFTYLGAIADVAEALEISYAKEDKLVISTDMQVANEESYGTSNLSTSVNINAFGDVQTAIEAALARVIGGSDKRCGDGRLMYGSRALCYAFRLFDGSYVHPSAYILTDDITQAQFTGNTYGYVEVESETEDTAPTYEKSEDIRHSDSDKEAVSYEGEYHSGKSVFRGVRDFIEGKYLGESSVSGSVDPEKFFKEGSAITVCIGKTKDSNVISPRSFVSANIYNLRFTITIPESIKQWKDIIQSVDFFLSEDLFGKSDYRLFKDVAEETLSPRVIVEEGNDLEKEASYKIKKDKSICLLYKLQKYNRDDVEKNLQTISSLNQLCSIEFESGTHRFSLLGDDDPLNGSITDDSDKWKSHSYINRQSLAVSTTLKNSIGISEPTGQMHLYNSRVHVYNKKDIIHNTPATQLYYADVVAEVTLSTPKGDKYLYQKIERPFTTNYYIYIRDLRARKVRLLQVYREASGTTIQLTPFSLYVDMKQSTTQNLSYATVVPQVNASSSKVMSIWGDTVSMPSSSEIAVSDVLNAMSFPPDNTIICGRSEVTSIATTALPVVQGAYREYPLFIATNDCIYAADLNNDGLYTSVRVVNPDVPRGEMIGVDGGVAYITSEGLKLMSAGGSATSVSRLLLDKCQRTLLEIQECEMDRSTFNESISLPLSTVSLDDMLNDPILHLSYDYKWKKIFVSSVSRKASYVYSITEQSWSTSSAYYYRSHAALPNSYGIRDNMLYLIKEGEQENKEQRNLVWLSAPITFGTTELKFIRRVKLYAYITPKIEARFFLWASNDNIHYRAVRALRAPRKTDRIIQDVDYGVLARLASRYCIIGVAIEGVGADDRISGIEIEVDKKYNNDRQMQ